MPKIRPSGMLTSMAQRLTAMVGGSFCAMCEVTGFRKVPTLVQKPQSHLVSTFFRKMTYWVRIGSS